MRDRELLELAAKASGINRILWNENSPGGWLDGAGAPSTWWNPLTDDGDALRLAVKLRITVELDLAWLDDASAYAACYIKQQYSRYNEVLSDDPEAATRRAIVRAAAAIGKAMLTAPEARS